MSYENLMRPIRIQNMTLRNRVMMAPMGTNLANPDGSISEEHKNYYQLRAKGGTGLIVVENACVAFPLGSNGTTQLRLDHDSFIPHMYELTEKVHAWGCKISIQVNHAGSAANGLRCVSLLPTSQFLHQITREQRAMYGILALILLASGVIISLLISKQYVPLKRFLQTVSEHMDAKEGTLDEAESMLLRLARENERLHSERLPPEERCVSLLLRGHPPESEEQRSLLESFAAGACACAIAAVPSGVLCEELRARVHQAFAPFCALLHLDTVSGRVVMLISLEPTEAEACRAALARAHALLRAAAQQTVALGVRSLQKEQRGLAASYMDAVSALECSQPFSSGKEVVDSEKKICHL